MLLRLPSRPSVNSKLCHPPNRFEVLSASVTHNLRRAGYATAQSKTTEGHPERSTSTWNSDGNDFHRTTSRHVLRGILRECTYFPDRFAASWIHRHALYRFRTYEAKNEKHPGDEAYGKRLETVRRKSRQALYQLQRANEGDKKMMIKALSMAYGRVGKRRRELLQPLLSVEASAEDTTAAIKGDDQGTDSLLEKCLPAKGPAPRVAPAPKKQDVKGRADGPVKTQVKEYVDDLPAQLRMLVKSQIGGSPPVVSRRNPRKLGVEIPELNTWYKQMPAVRVKNKLAQWYASLLSTVQPPLPKEEWYSLRDLALGATRPSLNIPRRKQLTSPPSVLEMVVMRGKLPNDLFRKDYAHQITPRFMQRLWAEVFSQCPLMQYDPGTERWNTTWGHHVLHDRNAIGSSSNSSESSPATGSDMG